MRRGNTLRLFGIIILVGLALWALSPAWGGRLGREDMRLGLDLRGGTHLVYEANLSQIGEGESPEDAMHGALNTIERRVNAYGVTEPVVQRQGKDRISVQLPGIRNIDEAVRLIGQTAQLDYRQLTPESESIVAQMPGADLEKLTEAGLIEWVPATAELDGKQVHLTGKYLKRNAAPVTDPRTNEVKVAFEFDSKGAKLFEQITERLLHKPLGIFLDNELVSAPTVQAVISTSGVIEGRFTLDEARNLAILLNEGALPIPLVGPIVREDIDPTLGADSINKSLIAGIIGLALVLVFMVLYYRLLGVLASLALLIYAVLVLAAFKLIPVTLTLAGIAAFILSIGIAVDANVLIFERLKEELRAGRTLGAAIEAGFDRAWPSIRDSNVSTFITCAILYWLGSSFGETRVMGFALTLGIGVAISMFTAIVITRTFLRSFVGSRLAKRLSLFVVLEPGRGLVPREQG